MRARMAIWQSGIAVELREIKLRDKPAEMLAASPKGTVPVLVLDEAEIVDESLDIMRWALAQSDPDDWMAGENAALIATNDGPFKDALDRYKYPHRFGLEDGMAHRRDGGHQLLDLEERLSKTAFLSGAKMGFTDVAIAPFIRQFAATDPAWFDAHEEFAHLRHWLKAFLQLPMLGAVMEKYPVWMPGHPPSLFQQN